MPLKVLIIGAGVAGPALALMLRRSSAGQEQEAYDLTVIERSPSLRTAGQQIDIRDHGVSIMRSLGLMSELEKVRVNEKGMSFVDSRGRSKAQFGTADTRSSDGSGDAKRKQRQGGVSEWEILRGDLVRVLYHASLGREVDLKTFAADDKDSSSSVPGLKYEFNKTVSKMEEDHEKETVAVTFSDDTTETYDLVVAADGQSSRTRRTMFATEEDRQASDSSFSPFLESRDLFMAYYSIPRAAAVNAVPAPCGQQFPSPPASPPVEKEQQEKKEDLEISKVYHAPGYRVVYIRHGLRDHVPESEARTQVYLAVLVVDDDSSSEEEEEGKSSWNSRTRLRSLLSSPQHEQKQFWARHYGDCGWITGSLVAPLLEEGVVDDFYMQEIGQVKMPERKGWVTRQQPPPNKKEKKKEEEEEEDGIGEKLGRIVLLGDAGYTPSPITGQGTTASLTGAFILAGELESFRHQHQKQQQQQQEQKEQKEKGQGQVGLSLSESALKNYENTIRPYVKEFQDLPPGVPRIAYYESAWGIKILHGVLGAVGALKLPQLMNRVLPETKGGKVLPGYEGLKLGGLAA